MLYILRLAIESERSQSEHESKCEADMISRENSSKNIILTAAVVRSAVQQEAAAWNMQNIVLWNPTPLVVSAAQELAPMAQIRGNCFSKVVWQQEGVSICEMVCE